MLNILVCVKQVPDINLVKMDPVTGSLIRAGVPAILNPLDANALEAAVRVKEAHGGSITVITMGPDMAKEALRECLAAGADRAVLLSDRAFANADTLATSYVIVSAAKMLGDFDLIFCGKESLDGATGQMGSQLAERFGASQISSTAKIVEVDTDARTLTAERDLERGVEVLPRYRRLAERLGGKLACTRPVFDRGVLPFKLVIGQSGVVVKPKLYISFGVSGAVNHVTGFSDADTVVAVNTDPDAAIFNYCTYGIVGDMDEVCDAMLAKLDK